MTPRRVSHTLRCLVVLLAFGSRVSAHYEGHENTISSGEKPLVKRPGNTKFKTVLSVDGGGVRGIISSVVLIEVEQSIKRHLLANPHLLPADSGISTVDDFDINLADYFDCMAGLSAGGWSTMYLSSRGGQGASRAVLDDPEIVEKYGVIPTGGAEGLRVFYKEYSKVIYPAETLNLTAGTPLDITNPAAPGVLSPLYPLEGLERTLEAFLGNTTLADVETSLLVPAVDLLTGVGVYFVQNAFKDPPVSSSAKLLRRSAPRMAPAGANGFDSDFDFDEGKDYYLRDVGTASGAVPIVHAAKPVSQVGNDTVEFVMVDGIFPVEATALPATFFVANENGFAGVEQIAVLSVGSGRGLRDYNAFANAGALGWLDGLALLGLSFSVGQSSLEALMDYRFNENPNVKPYQYLRVQTAAPVSTEEGMALSALTEASLVDVLEAIGIQVAQSYRPSIDIFVRDFIFG